MFEDKQIVIFGAHPDDIECGMGGTLDQLKQYKPEIVVFADTVRYNGDEILTEFDNSMKEIGLVGTLLHFDVDNMAGDLVEIREIIYSYRDADIFFTQSLNSTHQDHRIIGQAVHDIMLEKTVFIYEEIRSGQHQHINYYNKITAGNLAQKYRMIDCYKTQKKRHYLSDEAINTMARFRGGQINCNYAEGFEVGRIIL